MTFLIALLLGAGVLLTTSALDDTPIAATFQKIAGGGEALDLSGTVGMGDPTLLGGATGPGHNPGVVPGAGGNVGGDPFGGDPFAWVKNTITQAFGVKNPMEFFGVHLGVDIGTPFHTPITALRDGVVVRAGYGIAGGDVFVLVPSFPPYDQYLHLDELDVRAGQSVAAGQQIGLSGGENAGFPGAEHPASPQFSTGPHTHFEQDTSLTESPATAVNPTAFLDAIRRL